MSRCRLALSLIVRSHALRWGLLGALLLAGSLVPAGPLHGRAHAAGAGPITYTYDQAGRLTGVIDPGQANAGVYHYDAAGNITSIAHQPTNVVSILSFAPLAGAVGASVTITGTDFNSTASSDTVTFTGTSTPATITSASVTQLVVTVPSGATTGAISVAVTGAGSATSTASFTVSAATGPSISGVSVPSGNPTGVAVPGATFTIAGSGFNPIQNDNVVRVNGTIAQLQSASATSLVALVPPNTGSGPVTVTTPGGTVTATSQLYVPPPQPNNYTPAQVGSTGTISTGGTQTVSLSPSGKIAMLAFSGTQGERVDLTVGSGSFGNYNLQIYSPDNVRLAAYGFGTGSGDMDAVTLPLNGTYTIVLDPNGGTGSVPLTLNQITDVDTTITPNGSMVPVTTTVGNQDAYVTFPGVAGQKISVSLNNTINWNVRISISDTLGEVIWGPNTFSSGNGFVDTLTLLHTGTYTINVLHYYDSGQGHPGTVDLTLHQFSDAHYTVATDGTALPITLSAPGQDAYATFSATAGQRASLELNNSNLNDGFAQIMGPDGQVLLGPSEEAPGNNYFGTANLPETGTYTIWIRHVRDQSVGTADVSLFAFTDVNEPIAPNGAALPVNIADPGQNAYLTFTGTAGQRASLTMSAPMACTVTLTAPSGQTIGSTGSCQPAYGHSSGSGYFDTVTLPQTGTYTVALQPTHPLFTPPGTGTVNVNLYVFSDLRISLTPNSARTPVNLAPPGQDAYLSFTGSAGYAANVDLTGSTIASYAVTVYDPNGNTIGGPVTYGTGDNSLAVGLPTDGTYKVWIEHQGLNSGDVNTGSVSVQVNAAPGYRPQPATQFKVQSSTFNGRSSTFSVQRSTRITRVANGVEPSQLVQAQNEAVLSGAHSTCRGGRLWPRRHGRADVQLRHSVCASASHRRSTGFGTLMGRVWDADGRPLLHVTLSIGSRSTQSGVWGDFTLPHVPAGYRVLTVQGRTADRPGATYGIFEIRVHIRAGAVVALPYVIWLPKLDTAHEITIASPTRHRVVLTTPRIPGLKIILPKGAVVRERNGHIVHRLGITPIPTDRTPFPFPKGNPFPLYFTVQPADAIVTPAKVRVVYPNIVHDPPGMRMSFWSYDPYQTGWWIYGYGTISKDGRSIIPDHDVYFSEFTGAGSPTDHQPTCTDPKSCPPPTCPGNPGDPSGGGGGGGCSGGGGDSPPNSCPTDPGGSSGGDPVDLRSGSYMQTDTDLTLPDVIPINITRAYNQKDPTYRYFGQGRNFLYGMFMEASPDPNSNLQQVTLVLDDGAEVIFNRVSPGTGKQGAVFQSTGEPGMFYKSRVLWNGGGWDLRFTDGMVYTFTDFGAAGSNALLLSIRDPHGNTLRFTYSGPGGLMSGIKSPNGRWVQLNYPGNFIEEVGSIQDDLGRTVTYTYSGNDLAAVTDANGAVTKYTYDSSYYAAGRLLTITDPRGNTSLSLAYDGAGRVQSETLADGSTYTYSYTTNSSGQVTQTFLTDPRNVVRQVSFDADGYVTQDVLAAGTPQQETYTFTRQPGSGLIGSSTDQLGRQTTMTFDANGNVTGVTKLAGTAQAQTYSYTYDPTFSRVTSITDPFGKTTSYGYDAYGDRTSKTDRLGNITSYAYDGEGNPASITDPLSHTTQLTYTFGDLTSVTDALGRSSTRFVDAAGRVTAVTDAMGDTTTRSYDNLDRLAQVTDALGNSTITTYDGDGNVVSITDPEGNTTYYTFDSRNRRCATYDALDGLTAPPTTCPTTTDGHTTIYSYDGNSNVVKMIERNGQVTTYQYDPLNRPQLFTFNDGSTITYTYDLGDRLLHMVDSRSDTITNTFDGLNNLTSQTVPQAAGTVPCNGQSVSICYSYDSKSRRTGMTMAGQAPIAYTYGADDWLMAEGQVTAPGNIAISPGWNLLSLPVQSSALNSLSGVVSSLNHDLGAGAITAAATYSNGAFSVYVPGYSSNQTLSPTQGVFALDSKSTAGHWSPSGSAYAAGQPTPLTPGWNLVGEPFPAAGLDGSAINSQVGSSASGGGCGLQEIAIYQNGSYQTYIPSSGGSFHVPATAGMWVLCTQATSWTVSGSATPTNGVTFTYFANGLEQTRTFPNGISQTDGYDTANELTGITYANGSSTVGNLTYGYDLAGRRTTMGGSWARTSIPSAMSSATYNADNELKNWGATVLTYDNNGNLTNDGANTYTWDARDELASMSGSAVPTGSVSYTYDADGRRISTTTGGSSPTTTQYLLDNQNVVQELSGTGTPTASLLDGPHFNQYFTFSSGGQQSALLTDGLGSTLALTDSSGTLQTQYTYDPFGATTSSGTASANPMQFAGMQNDGTGQYFDHVRYFNPALARFSAQDPSGCQSNEANLYRYAGDSPVDAIDPLGLCVWGYVGAGLIGLGGFMVYAGGLIIGGTGFTGVGLVAGAVVAGAGAVTAGAGIIIMMILPPGCLD